MRHRYRRVLLFLICWMVSVAGIASATVPKHVVQEMLSQVDAERWAQQVEDLALNENRERPGTFFHSRYALRVRDAQVYDGLPHPDAACDNAADMIAERFESDGLQVEFDSFAHRRLSLSGTQGDYTMRNVIATLPGQGPHANQMYLITAHYDSIASKTEGWEDHWRTLPAPGATDNGSGVAEMLEIARILNAYPLDFTLRFVAFSGEELGLFGSKHYVERFADDLGQIAGVIDLDQLGHDADGVLDIHVVANGPSSWMLGAFESVQQLYGIDVDLIPVISSEFVYSDHAPFWMAGVDAVMVAEESSFDGPEWPEYTHSAEDTLDKLTLPLGERAIRLALATVAELAGPLEAEIPEFADLALTQLDLPNSAPLGRNVPVSFTVVNRGASAESTDLRLLHRLPDGTERVILNEPISLGVGGSISRTVQIIADGWGVHQIKLVLNPHSQPFEANYRDNRLVAMLTVTGTTQISSLLLYPNPFSIEREGSVIYAHYTLSQDAEVSVAVYTVTGQPVYETVLPEGDEGSHLGVNQIVIWDGRNDQGRRVAPGIYLCTLQASGSDGGTFHRTARIALY